MKINILYPFTPTWLDYPDNCSLALTVYIMGCDHGCKNCHNKQFQDPLYEYSTTVDLKVFSQYIDVSSFNYRTNKIVLSGGDPLYDLNAPFVKKFLEDNFMEYDVCIYTGYSMRTVKKMDIKGFTFLKCGVFNKELSQIPEKNNDYMQLASKNQQLYNSNFVLLSTDGRYYFGGNK